MRRFWLAIHLYLGLWLGVLFALLGLTGSALVFYPELDRLINPQTRVSQRVESTPSLDAIHQRLRQLHPQRDGPWRIESPLTSHTPIMARYYNPIERAGRKFAPLMLTLDPQTLELTTQRFWGEYGVSFLYDLHYTLLMQELGHNIVGVLGVMLSVSLLTGLYLWWPTVAGLMRAIRPRLRPGAVLRTYDLHTLSGLYAWLVLMTLALTGTVLAFPNLSASLVQQVAPLSNGLPVLTGLIGADQASLSLDDAVIVAQRQFPRAEVRWVETPGAQGKPISVRMYQPDEPGRRFPQTYVLIHPSSGEVLAVQDATRASSGSKFMAWIHPLHNGEAFGLFGRLLACFVGLLPTLLLVTGILRWRQKREAIISVASKRAASKGAAN